MQTKFAEAEERRSGQQREVEARSASHRTAMEAAQTAAQKAQVMPNLMHDKDGCVY